MPRRLLPRNAFKRGIDERNPETIAWALLEQARLDYFADDWVGPETDEDGEVKLKIPLMSVSEILKTVDMLDRIQERKHKRGEDDSKANGTAESALSEWRKAVGAKSKVKKKL